MMHVRIEMSSILTQKWKYFSLLRNFYKGRGTSKLRELNRQKLLEGKNPELMNEIRRDWCVQGGMAIDRALNLEPKVNLGTTSAIYLSGKHLNFIKPYRIIVKLSYNNG